MKCLIVVDMQVDFITGSLGSKDAEAIVPTVVNKVKNFDGKVVFTGILILMIICRHRKGRNFQ